MNEKQKQVMLWISVALWMGVIFMFSAQNATESSSLSGTVVGVIMQAVKAVFPNIGPVQMESLETGLTFFVRKAAHASIYFILGVLVYSAVGKNVSRGKRFFLALGICFAYACTDELHQRFVPGRSGEFRDVCIDTCGALFGVGVTALIGWLRHVSKGRRGEKRAEF